MLQALTLPRNQVCFRIQMQVECVRYDPKALLTVRDRVGGVLIETLGLRRDYRMVVSGRWCCMRMCQGNGAVSGSLDQPDRS